MPLNRSINNIFFPVLIVSLALLSGCSCNSLFFWPQPTLIQTPSKGNITYEDIYIDTPDNIRLHGWLLKPQTPIKGRILFLHGNAQNISTHIASIYWLPHYGYEVAMIDYRGYGRSEGTACLPDVIIDVESSFAWLEDYNQGEVPLFIIGQSLGASLAAYSTARNAEWPVAGVILDSPFASYRDIVRDKARQSWLTWTFQYPISWMFSDKFSPQKNVDKISPTPLLIFYSNQDIVVPPKHSKPLFDQALEPKSLVITSTSHITTFSSERYREKLIAFLEANSTTASNHVKKAD